MPGARVWTGLLCLTLISLVQSAPEDFLLSMTKISPKEPAGGETQLNICITGNTKIPDLTAGDQVTLVCDDLLEEPVVEINTPAETIDDGAAVGSICTNHKTTVGLTTGLKLKCFITIHYEAGDPYTEAGVATFVFQEYNALSPCSGAYYWKTNKVMGWLCTGPSTISSPTADFDKIASSTNIAYFKNNADDPDPGTMYPQCKDVDNEDIDANLDHIQFCGDPLPLTTVSEGEAITVEKANLKYGATPDDKKFKLAVTVAPASGGAGTILDLVLINKNGVDTGTPADGAEVTFETGDSDDVNTKYLVVRYDNDATGVTGFATGTHKDLEVTAVALSDTIIQMEWTRDVGDTADEPYKIKLDPPPGGSGFGEADVICKDPSIYCYGYFTGLPAEEYTPQVTPPSGVGLVTAPPIKLPPSFRKAKKTDIRVRRLELEWWGEGSAVNATLCFSHQSSNTSGYPHPENYELTLISQEGARLRVQGAFRASGELLCFPATPLNTQHFPAASGKAWAVLAERDGQGGKVLASGESQLFFLAPEVKRVSPEVVRVSWTSPGGHTFTVRRPGDAAPLVTSLACKSCSYDIKSEAKEAAEHMTVVVETEEGPLKVAAEASSSTAHKASKDLQAVTVSKIIHVPDAFEICYDDDPGAVTRAEMTAIDLNNPSSVEQTNYNAEAVEGSCVTFSKDIYAWTGKTTFVLRLYSGDVGSDSQLGWGSVAVTLPDSDLPVCEAASAVGDDLLRLSCSKYSDSTAVSIDGIDLSDPTEPLDDKVRYFKGASSLEGRTVDVSRALSGVIINDNSSNPTTLPFVTYQQDLTLNAGLVITETKIVRNSIDGASTLEIKGFTTTTTTGEVMYYNTSSPEEVQKCDVENEVCTASGPGGDTFQSYTLVAVAVNDGGTVDSSGSSTFKDHQVRVNQLTNDAIEVSWVTKEAERETFSTEIKCQGSEGCGGPFNKVNNDCGDSPCRVYFTSMNEHVEGTATTQEAGSTNVGAFHFTLDEGTSAGAKATLKVTDNGGQRLLKVTPVPEVTGEGYTLAVIDQEGASVTSDSDTHGLPEVDINVLNEELLRVLVYHADYNSIPEVPLSADVNILNRNQTKVSQVGYKILKASWENKNSDTATYNVASGGNTEEVECRGGNTCNAYLRDLMATENVAVTITEKIKDIEQIVTLNADLKPNLEDINIKQNSIRWDDRLKVCFRKPESAVSYELGLEKGDQHLQTTTSAEVEDQGNGEVCILSGEVVDVGAYLNLWMLATAYDSSGEVVASGEKTWQSIFLSADRVVYAAVKKDVIVASWHLLDDTTDITEFQLNLRSDAGSIQDEKADVSSSTFTFSKSEPGVYTVCVRASKKTPDILSEEVCSNIITISQGDTPIDVPEVSDVTPSTSTENTVLLTWKLPDTAEQVSSVFIAWTTTTPPAREHGPHLPPASLPTLHQAPPKADPETNFMLVPATATSVEITNLEEGAEVTFCVTPVLGNMVPDNDECTTANLGDFEQVGAPNILNTANGNVIWDEVDGAQSYLVEWSQVKGKRGGSTTETDTSCNLAELASPGSWTVSVRARKGGSISDQATENVNITGVAINPSQVGSQTVRVSWSEDPAPTEAQDYVVTVKMGDHETTKNIKCLETCSTEVELDQDSPNQGVASITITSSTTATTTAQFFVYNLHTVKISATTLKSETEAEVTWEPVESADNYQLTLYSDANRTTIIDSTPWTLPYSYTIKDDNNPVKGYLLTIEPRHGDSSGDEAEALIAGSGGGGPGRNNTPAIVAGVLGGVLGVAIISFIVIVVVKKQQGRKEVRDELHMQDVQRQQQQREEEEIRAKSMPYYNRWGARLLGRKPPTHHQ